MLCEKLSVFLFFMHFTAIWSFTFNEVPEDTAALLGEPAQLNCSLTCNNDCRGLVWVERATTGGIDVDIYYGEDGSFNQNNPKKDRYAIVPGTKNLLVKKVQISDASRYICRPDRGGGPADTKIAFLTAMGPLSVSSNGIAVEGGKASVTCNVKFYKHADFSKTPSLIWDIPGAEQTGGEGANDVTRTANLTVDSSDDGRSYRCRVYYSSPPPQFTNEKNVPITVHYGPKEVNITTYANGGLARIQPGEKLICSASGKPAPTYKWVKLAGPEQQPSELNQAELTVNTKMKGENTYACEASNTVGNEVKSMRENITFTVFVPTTTTTTTTVAPTTTVINTTPLDTSPGGRTTDGKTGGSIGKDNPPINTAAIAGGCAAGAVVIIIIIVVVIVMKRRKSKEAKDGLSADEEKQPGPPQTNPTMHPDVIRPANDNHHDNHDDPRNKNVENIQYADLALDDTPRSRKPIQLYDMALDTEYAEIQHGKRNY